MGPLRSAELTSFSQIMEIISFSLAYKNGLYLGKPCSMFGDMEEAPSREFMRKEFEELQSLWPRFESEA